LKSRTSEMFMTCSKGAEVFASLWYWFVSVDTYLVKDVLRQNIGPLCQRPTIPVRVLLRGLLYISIRCLHVVPKRRKTTKC
jgi:hypothetical protein